MSLVPSIDNASWTDDPERIAQIAEQALDEGEEERVLPLLERTAEKRSIARIWQWKGLLERALDHHQQALASFAEAARLEPTDPSIAHGHARISLEAGMDARALYDRALELAPNEGAVLVGRASAQAAAGEGDRAVEGLAHVLGRAPAWTYGHEQLAQLLATQGRGGEATSSIERALFLFPEAAPLWETLLKIQVRRRSYEAILPTIERAKAGGTDSPQFALYEGIHAAELNPDTCPEALFGPSEPEVDAALATWRIRHLLRVGALDRLLPLVDRELQVNPTAEIYAYAATAWRLANDPRLDWLEGDPRFIGVFDITDALPPLGELADTLRQLHVAKGEYLDQSVRGGTQTDGSLLSRIDPTIQALREAIVPAVEAFVAKLPTTDPDHPLLQHRRDRRVRFAGSWSVRLRDGGRHSNHVHPQGWISSALYVSLPGKSQGEAGDAGWLTLGQPDETLGLDMPPKCKVEPVEGLLVLFPSWMWHGTIPFEQGERLSVAFDVSPPL